MLEMVQRRAARFVTGVYTREASVTNMMTTLGWTTLEERRKNLRLTSFYKITHGELQLDLDQYAYRKTSRLRKTHDQQYDIKSKFISTTQLANSFFPETILHWNKLSQELIDSKTTDTFKSKLNMSQPQTNKIE